MRLAKPADWTGLGADTGSDRDRRLILRVDPAFVAEYSKMEGKGSRPHIATRLCDGNPGADLLPWFRLSRL